MTAVDAAGIEIAAIGRAIDDARGKMPTREQVRAEVAKTRNYRGVLGSTTFDADGDTSVKVISIFGYVSGDPNAANNVEGADRLRAGEPVRADRLKGVLRKILGQVTYSVAESVRPILL